MLDEAENVSNASNANASNEAFDGIHLMAEEPVTADNDNDNNNIEEQRKEVVSETSRGQDSSDANMQEADNCNKNADADADEQTPDDVEEVKPIFDVAEDDIQSFATNEIDTIEVVPVPEQQSQQSDAEREFEEEDKLWEKRLDELRGALEDDEEDEGEPAQEEESGKFDEMAFEHLITLYTLYSLLTLL